MGFRKIDNSGALGSHWGASNPDRVYAAGRRPNVVPARLNKGRRVVNNSGDQFGVLVPQQGGPINNAFDISDFPDGLIREMLTGILTRETSFADELCGRQYRQKTSLTGGVPIRGGKATVARGENQGLRPGAEAKPYTYDVSSATYEALAYVGYGTLTDEERGAAGYYYDQDAVALEIETAVREANTALDLKLEAVLESTTLNTEFALGSNGGDWDDFGASSTMFQNLRTLRQVTVPGADTIILGRNAENTMLQHDDFLASEIAGNYYAGGSGEESVLHAWLRQYIGFTNVFKFDRLYNADTDPADDINYTYAFDNGVWVGYADDLVLIHPDWEDQDKVEVERVTRQRLHEIQFSRYDDIIRPTTKKGAIVTGLNAA